MTIALYILLWLFCGFMIGSIIGGAFELPPEVLPIFVLFGGFMLLPIVYVVIKYTLIVLRFSFVDTPRKIKRDGFMSLFRSG